MNELIENSDLRIWNLRSSIERIKKCVAQLRERKSKVRFYSETYLTDKEVQALLKVSRRTLHVWRDNGLIAYIYIGGKILYRESDIEKTLSDHMRNAK